MITVMIGRPVTDTIPRMMTFLPGILKRDRGWAATSATAVVMTIVPDGMALRGAAEQVGRYARPALAHAHSADHDGGGTGQYAGVHSRICVVGHDVAFRVDAEKITRQ
jgi:hypothetical protein